MILEHVFMPQSNKSSQKKKRKYYMGIKASLKGLPLDKSGTIQEPDN